MAYARRSQAEKKLRLQLLVTATRSKVSGVYALPAHLLFTPTYKYIGTHTETLLFQKLACELKVLIHAVDSYASRPKC